MDEQTAGIIARKPARMPEFAAPGGTSPFFRIGLIFFLASGLLCGGLYFYRNFLSNSLQEKKTTLADLEVEFEPSLITEVQRVSSAISASKEILAKRVFQTRLFAILEEKTIPQISFGTFSYAHDKKSLVLVGEAASYADIARQSSVFETADEIKEVMFSNLLLKETGNVSFTLTINFK